LLQISSSGWIGEESRFHSLTVSQSVLAGSVRCSFLRSGLGRKMATLNAEIPSWWNCGC